MLDAAAERRGLARSDSLSSVSARPLEQGAAGVQETLKRHGLAGEENKALCAARFDACNTEVEICPPARAKRQAVNRWPEGVRRSQVLTSEKARPDPFPQNGPRL